MLDRGGLRMAYRGASLIRDRTPLGPYRRPVPRVLGGSYWGGRFLMSEVPLYISRSYLAVDQPSPPPGAFKAPDVK